MSVCVSECVYMCVCASVCLCVRCVCVCARERKIERACEGMQACVNERQLVRKISH